MQDAGFAHIDVDAANHDLELPPPQQFLWQYIHGTPLSAAVSQTRWVGYGASGSPRPGPRESIDWRFSAPPLAYSRRVLRAACDYSASRG
jgi:hypothetical protein